MLPLRDYQEKLKAEIYSGWQAHHRNVIAVAPTGAGKTKIKAKIFHENQTYPGIAIAHRQELVGQISCAIAESGTYHRIIASKAVIAFCISQHIKRFGRSYYHAQAPLAVAGVDTLLRRTEELQQWISQVRIWDIDEAHHVLSNNKWGKAVLLFPHAWGVGFTATPSRCDRKSLARAKSGVFDHMVIGPTMRDLINRGYLADYIIYGPPESIDRGSIRISENTGELVPEDVRRAAHDARSTITGDIVEHYMNLTPGKLGITFCVDIKLATDTAAAFRQKGVPAEVVTGETPDAVRQALMDKFVRREILELVNVDLFGEGVDVPGVEVVSMGRPTESEGLYDQQFGRMIRPAPGKTHGILIDHVGNVKKHKLPDRERFFTLDTEERGRKKKATDDGIPVTTCTRCFRAYEALTRRCPFCGHVEEPAGRSTPDQVQGELALYGPELLAQLGRAADAAIRTSHQTPNTAAEVIIQRNMEFRRQAQMELRDAISLWAGVSKEVYQRSDAEIHRRFYFKFGVDVMTAQTLGRPEAEKLTALIREDFI